MQAFSGIKGINALQEQHFLAINKLFSIALSQNNENIHHRVVYMHEKS
jgi:hypothetical protein